MDLNSFISHFREQFDLIEDDVVIAPDTEFRSLEDWDSLVALSVIAMADDEYNVELNGDDIRGATTVADLYAIVERKKS